MTGNGQRSVRLADGTRLAYRVRGEAGAAERFALIHSLGLGGEALWGRVADALAARGAAVLTYDCRGHGVSEKPAGPYTIEQFAGDLGGVLDAAGWDRAHVAGCSMGGSAAIAFAIAAPARVMSLALVDTTAWYGPNTAAWEERAARVEADGFAPLLEMQLGRWFTDAFRAADRATVDAVSSAFLANDRRAFAASCRMLAALDLRDGARGIAAPTAVVVGAEDEATPVAMARDLHERIAGSRLEILDPGRHLTPLECADRVVAILTALVPASS